MLAKNIKCNNQKYLQYAPIRPGSPFLQNFTQKRVHILTIYFSFQKQHKNSKKNSQLLS